MNSPREEMRDIITRRVGADEAELIIKRVVLRLGGATHDETLRAYPKLEPKRDRDGVVR